MWNKEKQEETRQERYVNFLLLARLKLFDKTRNKLSQEFSLKARKALEEYQNKMDALKKEHYKEWEAIESIKLELEEAIKNELGEQYSLLDICYYSGKVLREKELNVSRISPVGKNLNQSCGT